MEWIDSMRGFTMILVVAYHVSMMGFGENPKESSYLSLCVLFRMPLFFFISGFFAYSAKTAWSLPMLGRLLWKKLRIQIVPTAVFFALFIIMLHRSSWEKAIELLQHDTKGGYWFTLVLLQMFVLYYLFAYAESFFKPRLQRLRMAWLPIALFWLLALGAYATWYMPSWFHYQKEAWLQWSSFSQTIIFLHFFLAGNLVRRHWHRVERLFDTSWFPALILFIAILMLCEHFRWHELRKQWANLPRTIAMYSLMTTVILFFRHYAERFSRHTIVGRCLQYIGVRTLDIYLLHFLFIVHLPAVGPWLRNCKPNFTLDLLCSLAGATAVIAVCLIASSILRLSPFLKRHLFGRG